MANWNGAVASREEIRELKRRAAVRVAARIFNEKGYHATSLDEIADEIGVTKTALYYYFKNKEQLLYECLVLTYDCGQTAQQEAQALDGSAYDKLCLMYRRFIDTLMEERGAYTTTANIKSLPECQQKEMFARRTQLETYIRDLVQDAITEGSVRDVDPRVTASFFLGAVNWILRWHSEEEALPANAVAAHFVDLFVNGIVKRN